MKLLKWKFLRIIQAILSKKVQNENLPLNQSIEKFDAIPKYLVQEQNETTKNFDNEIKSIFDNIEIKMSQQASQEIKYIKSLNVAHLNARNSQATNFEMLRNLTEVSKVLLLINPSFSKTFFNFFLFSVLN